MHAIAAPEGRSFESKGWPEDEPPITKATSRIIVAYYDAEFVALPHSRCNKSLGLIVTGEPLTRRKGNLLLCAMDVPPEDKDADGEAGDSLPADMHQLVRYMRNRELSGGSSMFFYGPF